MIDQAELRKRLRKEVDTSSNAEAFIKLAEYHRKAMEARRTVAFQALVAVLALFGAVFVKGESLLAAAEPEELFGLRVQLSALLIVLVTAYLCSVLVIDTKNHADWKRYVVAEARAWQLLDPAHWRKGDFYGSFAGEADDYVPSRSPRKLVSGAWGTVGGVVSVLALLVAALGRIW